MVKKTGCQGCRGREMHALVHGQALCDIIERYGSDWPDNHVCCSLADLIEIPVSIRCDECSRVALGLHITIMSLRRQARLPRRRM